MSSKKPWKRALLGLWRDFFNEGFPPDKARDVARAIRRCIKTEREELAPWRSAMIRLWRDAVGGALSAPTDAMTAAGEILERVGVSNGYEVRIHTVYATLYRDGIPLSDLELASRFGLRRARPEELAEFFEARVTKNEGPEPGEDSGP